jgi:hypothetical protein
MRIWKYPIEILDRIDLAMPPGAQLLTIEMQHGKCCLWALVDETKMAMEIRTIAIYGTGNPIPDEPGNYIATFQLESGALVFHAFDVSANDQITGPAGERNIHDQNASEAGASPCTCLACIQAHDLRVDGIPLNLARMVVCPICGDKRCIHAKDHNAPCAKSDIYAHNLWVEKHITA